MSTVLTVRARAKINLDLRVVTTREDGYHDLATVFQAIALHDTMRFSPAEGPLRLACTPPVTPPDRDNLVWRAAERLWAASGRAGEPRGVHIELTKTIPVQAGLGGGSADAAMTLVALRRLWGLDVDGDVLRRLAASLGADVAFFLLGGTASGRGRGDRLHPLPDLPPHFVLIARPSFGVSTADAYRWYDARPASPSAPPALPDRSDGWADVLRRCRNDLEQAVGEHHPQIPDLVRTIRAHGPVLAMMCGSGSAVFGLFERQDNLDAAASALTSAGAQVWKSETLGRAAYWEAAGVAPPPG